MQLLREIHGLRGFGEVQRVSPASSTLEDMPGELFPGRQVPEIAPAFDFGLADRFWEVAVVIVIAGQISLRGRFDIESFPECFPTNEKVFLGGDKEERKS